MSIANQAVVDRRHAQPESATAAGWCRASRDSSIFSFLLLTPTGWLTLYLIGSGGMRAAAAWFDDPVGDPLLTGLDDLLLSGRDRRQRDNDRRTRDALEGPEIPDRVVTSAAGGHARLRPRHRCIATQAGMGRGVIVFTADAAYRIGEPVERTIAGRLRTLYPLTEHKDLEAVRKSVHYDLPVRAAGDAGAARVDRTTEDRSE